MSESVSSISVPPGWQTLDASKLGGTVLVIGGTDTGKSTLVRWLVEQQRCVGHRVGLLDADPGQNSLGVPATIGLALSRRPFAEPKVAGTWFVGSISPKGHMLPILTGLERLQEVAIGEGCETLVVDTSGMIGPDTGGSALKEWKIELLRPEGVIAIRRDGELEHLLTPLRLERRFRLHELSAAEAVRRRTPAERSARRRQRFRKYFTEARRMTCSLDSLPLYGLDNAAPGRLLAFLDGRGLTLAVGAVESVEGNSLHVWTPLFDHGEIAGARIGRIAIEPHTGAAI